MNLLGLHSDSTVSELDEIKAAFARMEQRYQAEIKILKEQILLLTARLYGRKSEKINQLYEQLLLFEEKQDEATIPALDKVTTILTQGENTSEIWTIQAGDLFVPH